MENLLSHFANFVTDFADQAVMLPLAIAVALAMAMTGWTRGAVSWLLGAAFAWGVMLGLKLVGANCGLLLFGPSLTSPSGHVSSASFVYGGLGAVIANKWLGRLNWALPCSLAVAAVIGASRVALGAHSVPEAVLGGLVGIAGVVIFTRHAGPPPQTIRFRWTAMAVVVVIALLHGLRLPAERTIQNFAGDIWPLSMCVQQAKLSPSADEAIRPTSEAGSQAVEAARRLARFGTHS